jgi:predicted metal-dependent peptidase
MSSVERPVHEIALSKAKIDLMRRPDSAFYISLVFSLQHEFSEAVPTARTNGTRVKYNPHFFMSLTPEERIFLILHETMHGVLLHIERGHSFDLKRFNIAGDHVINLMLIERGFQMPVCGLADPTYQGMSTEEIYRLLPESADDDEGFGQDIEESDGKERESIIEDLQEIIVRAAMQSEMAGDKPGTIPGEVQIYLNKLLKPKLPWNRILQKYLHAFNKNDYTFRRPNRRFLPDHYLPSLYSENLDSLAIAVDTSGSVSDRDFNQFISETHSILRMMQPREIAFIQFDSTLKSVNTVKSIRDLMGLTFTGRGGTDIEPVIEWANENKPQLLLLFSDGYFHFPEPQAKVPVVWIIHNNSEWQAPYGKTIHYDL